MVVTLVPLFVWSGLQTRNGFFVILVFWLTCVSEIVTCKSNEMYV